LNQRLQGAPSEPAESEILCQELTILADPGEEVVLFWDKLAERGDVALSDSEFDQEAEETVGGYGGGSEAGGGAARGKLRLQDGVEFLAGDAEAAKTSAFRQSAD